MVKLGSRTAPGNGSVNVLFCLLGSVVGFALVPIFLRYFADTLDAWTVNGVRYSVGALFWLPFLLLLDRNPKREKTATVKKGNIWIDALVPSVTNALSQAMFGLGPYYVSASAVGFIMRLSFLFTIIVGFIVLAEERRLARKRTFWAGSVLSVVGVMAMYYEKFAGGDGLSFGMFIILMASVCMGVYAVAVRYYMAAYSARKSFTVISLYTSVILVALMFCFGDYGQLRHISAWMWLILTLSALIGIAFGHVLLYQAIRYLGPVVANGVQVISPFITYGVAAVCLGERLTPMEWVGGWVLVVSGIMLVVARMQVERDLSACQTPSSHPQPAKHPVARPRRQPECLAEV